MIGVIFVHCKNAKYHCHLLTDSNSSMVKIWGKVLGQSSFLKFSVDAYLVIV